jgi:hypothetical protein
LCQPKAGELYFGSHYSSSDGLSLKLRDTNRGRRIRDLLKNQQDRYADW